MYENGGHLKATAGLLEGRLNFQQHKQFELKVGFAIQKVCILVSHTRRRYGGLLTRSLQVCGGREEGADPVIDSTIEARCSNGTTAVKQSVNVTLFSEQDGRVPLFAAILAGSKAGGLVGPLGHTAQIQAPCCHCEYTRWRSTNCSEVSIVLEGT